jgi:isoamylase
LTASGQSTGTKPTRAQKDDVIYEVNVRGLTKQDPNTPTDPEVWLLGASEDAGTGEGLAS